MNSDKKKKNPKKEATDPEPSKVADDPGLLKPARPRIGESKDNLSQRSDWFQKRSGKK